MLLCEIFSGAVIECELRCSMTMSISLSPRAEAKLKERAAAEGKDPVAYVTQLVEEAVTKPSLDEILAPFRKEVAESGMSDEKLDQFYEGLREEAWQERQGRKA
jgi:hypothetical protein